MSGFRRRGEVTDESGYGKVETQWLGVVLNKGKREVVVFASASEGIGEPIRIASASAK